MMTPDELKNRTKQFALSAIRFVGRLPKSSLADILGRQLLRSATSVGANYRSACRAKSQADFVSKMAVVQEEADESSYWLELLQEIALVNNADIVSLLQEAEELTAIATASTKTARQHGVKTIKNHQPAIVNASNA